MTPNTACLVLSLSMLLVTWEFCRPGRIIPGVLGAVGVLLGGYSLFSIPYRVPALVLILLGVFLLVLAAYTHGWLPGGSQLTNLFGGVLAAAGMANLPSAGEAEVSSWASLVFGGAIFVIGLQLTIAAAARRRKRDLTAIL